MHLNAVDLAGVRDRLRNGVSGDTGGIHQNSAGGNTIGNCAGAAGRALRSRHNWRWCYR